MAEKKTAAKKTAPKKTAAKKTATNKTGKKTVARSGGSSKGKKNATSTEPHSGERLVDHEQIRMWAEERNAKPSCVRKTGGKGDVGMIRLDFPGYSGEDSLQEISWDEWFKAFDENGLALIVQETTAGGQKSNFNKLVKRTAQEQRPKTRSAG
jgi:hypothetical protein